MRYDNPADGENNWQYRRDRIARLIRGREIDLFGAQELLANQFDDMRAALPEYEAVGVGREDGRRAGEFNPVFYRRDRFEPVASGTFWLSQTPDVAGSKGWDGACRRIATWCVLRDGEGPEFLFVNTHLDHVGEVARREGVALLLRRIDSLRGARPVVLTGDFNSVPSSPVIAHVLSGGLMRHARDAAADAAGLSWSFSDFGRLPECERELIDYVFIGGDVRAERYEVLPDTLDGGYLSDHAPVVVRLRIGDGR